MKKIYSFIAVALVAGMASCNNATETTTTTTTTTKTETTIPAPAAPAQPTPAAEPEGLTLMSKSDCGTCHNADAKVVGPAYKDIAAKYPNNAANVSKLALSIIKGEVGTWGTVPMPAHASLSQGDAEKMTSYILSMSGK